LGVRVITLTPGVRELSGGIGRIAVGFVFDRIGRGAPMGMRRPLVRLDGNIRFAVHGNLQYPG